MTRPTELDFDQRIADWLEDDPIRAPRPVADTVLAAYPSIPQRRTWRVLRRFPDMNTHLPLATAAVIGAIAVGGVFYFSRSGQPPTWAPGSVAPASVLPATASAAVSPAVTSAVASPAATANRAGDFVRPFEYVIPRTSALKPTLESRYMYAFTQGSAEIYPRDQDGSFPPGVRGITVASTDGAVTHPCPVVDGGASRVPVRTEARGFLEDLRTLAGIGLGEATPTTMDGRPALVVIVKPAAASCDFGDFHVLYGGLGSGYVLMTVPSRLSLVEVNGVTVVVQIWAPTEDELASWLPIATEFLDSVHFTQRE